MSIGGSATKPSISATNSIATLSMQATTNKRSVLNLIRVFQAACNNAATNTRIVASTPLSLPASTELIRHMSAAVYTATDHAALSCAHTYSNKFLLLPDPRGTGSSHA